MSNEKLAEALERTARHRAATEGIDPDQWRVVLFKWEALALQAHAAEAAQAQAQSGEWPKELMLRDTGLKDDLGGLGQRIFTTAGAGYKKVKYVRADLSHAAAPPQAGEPVGHARTDGCMHFAYLPWSVKDGDPVYAAPPAERVQEKAEPVAWMHPELHKRHPYADECLSAEAIDGWVPLYTHPQPAQDASKYQELLMAVEKKFPGESRHETALRYIRETELQSCEPKCDAARAKEAGNG